jgi:HlyD family secretion protein/adhesin transport system membrane fusion protein
MRRSRRVKLAKRLSQPALLEETGPPLALRALLTVITLLLGGAVAWASVTELHEVASTQGKIVPAGQVHRIQHVTGGRISHIAVSEGQLVSAGTPLARLDATTAESNLGALRARRAGLVAKAARLRAFLNDREPDFTPASDYPEIVADQREALAARRNAWARKREVFEARIARHRMKLKSLRDQRQGVADQVALLEEAVSMRRDLSEKGLVSGVVLLENERSLSKSRNQLIAIEGDIQEARQAIAEARGERAELEARLKADASDELGTVQADLSEVREKLRKHRERTRRTVLKAPVTGVVQGIDAHTVGAVVDPGETVLEVVPVDDKMIAEVRLSPRDVGHVRPGQHAQVQLTSYDFARFGAIKGDVRRISATTFQSRDGRPYYKVRIGLERAYVGQDPDRNPILPGMVVQADIRTGGKTLLNYLLHPVRRGLDKAFTER